MVVSQVTSDGRTRAGRLALILNRGSIYPHSEDIGLRGACR